MRCLRSVVLDLCLWWSSAAFFAALFATHSLAAANLTDSNAFERAISQLQPGRVVNLPAGVFALTAPIRLPSGTRLIGAGQDKTIVHYAGPKSGVMMSLQDCEDVEVAHLTLDARNDPNVLQGISGGNARRLKLHHLSIRNLARGTGFGPHGILFAGLNPTRAGGVTDSEISDCLIENIAPDAPFGCGIRFSWGSSRNRVQGNTVRVTGRGGIFGDNGSTDLLIRSNLVSGSGGEGLGIEVWEACDRAVIEDNRIDHWLSIGGSDYCAVRRNVVSDKSGVVKFIGIEGIGAHCVYTDNLVDDGQQIGFSVSNVNPKDYAYWGYNTVLNCIQWGAQFQGEKSGIAYHYFYHCKFNHTSSNRGKPIYPGDAGNGFRMNGGVRDCVFEECEFSANEGYGLQFGGSGLDSFSFLRCAILGNKGPAMVGLQEYRTLEWTDCTVGGNAENELRPQKPFKQPTPVATIKAPARGRVGEPIHLVNDSRSTTGRIAAVLWDFNDGAPVSEGNPTHIYTQPGEYRVTLIVWDELGRAARAEQRLELSVATTPSPSPSPNPPYPHGSVVESIAWHWETRVTAAPGSDLWPVTWGPDDHLYAAWGDGGGFGGTDSDGRVPLGFARIEGNPENWHGVNVNGGKNPEHPASFPRKGKTTGVAFVDGVLYATVNLEDGKWPDVNHALAWSTNYGATWTKAEWLFAKGTRNFQPAKFACFGRDYAGVPDALAGYVYLYGPRQSSDRGSGNRLYLARAPRTRLRERAAYEFFQRSDAAGTPVWAGEITQAQPVFVDPNGVTPGSVVYDPGLKRFLLTCFHVGPGQLGVFDAPNPWGPWTTIAYYEDWGQMAAEGEGLTCGFPQKWMSHDGLTLWSVFSVYGEGAKRGINAHDKFNLVKATLKPFTRAPGEDRGE